MAILYKYLAKLFLRNVIFCITGLAVLVAVTVLFGKIDNALAGWSTFVELMVEIGRMIPTVLEIVMPLLILLATVITITRVSSDFELVAMKFAGMSRFQVMTPLLVCAILISLLGYANQNYLYRWIRSDSPLEDSNEELRHQWRLVDNAIFYVERFDPIAERLFGIRIMRFDRDPFVMVEIDTAEEAVKIEDGWVLQDRLIRRKSDNLWRSFESGSSVLASREFPVVIDSRNEDMHHAPLLDVIRKIMLMQSLGISGKADALELHQKAAALLMPFLMVLLATPISQVFSRNERVELKYVVALILGLIYMVGNETFFLLGKGNYVHPAIAVWSFQAVFLALALVLIARSR